MRTLNIGDGHRGAGGGRMQCVSKAAMLKQKDDTLTEILSLWAAQAAVAPEVPAG